MLRVLKLASVLGVEWDLKISVVCAQKPYVYDVHDKRTLEHEVEADIVIFYHILEYKIVWVNWV